MNALLFKCFGISLTISYKYQQHISLNMPQVNIDDDAYRIIAKERDEMKKRGIRASLSDAIRSLAASGQYIVDH